MARIGLRAADSSVGLLLVCCAGVQGISPLSARKEPRALRVQLRVSVQPAWVKNRAACSFLARWEQARVLHVSQMLIALNDSPLAVNTPGTRCFLRDLRALLPPAIDGEAVAPLPLLPPPPPDPLPFRSASALSSAPWAPARAQKAVT